MRCCWAAIRRFASRPEAVVRMWPSITKSRPPRRRATRTNPSFTVPPGGRTITSLEGSLSTLGQGDDHQGSCAGGSGGADQVWRLIPGQSGTLRVRIGYGGGEPLWYQGLYGDPRIWDEVLYARASCDATEDLACADAGFASEELFIPVTSGVAVWLFVDGYDDGWYSRGPYDLHLDFVP